MRPTLTDPRHERDSCGIGFVADVRGRASRFVADSVLEALARVRHRGAVAADGVTGDGAGVLLPLPTSLLPAPWSGLAMVFLRDESARERIEAACAAEGIGTAGWREVPVEPGALGAGARAAAPRIEQLLLRRPLCSSAHAAELSAFRARKRAERVEGAYVVSLSFRTITYKALCSADRLADFYPELRDPRLAVPFGIFHQRFSTNTTPSWERAQPFRMLCHNGEINAIDGNVAWMRAREGELDASLRPVIEPDGSDSAMLDNALELLVRHGRDVRHALAMLVPEAWQSNPDLDDELRAFYRYHAALVEPWDGPAGLVFTDGKVVGAALDRNGLRPLRYAIADDGIVACASEAGAVPLVDGRIRRGRLGPGQMLAVDPSVGVEEPHAIRARLAGKRTYRRLIAPVERVPAGDPEPPREESLTPRHVLAGYTKEDLNLVLRPSASDGSEPVSSMGDDAALPPLAGRARLVPSYLRQRFAQVTNPAIDHLREREVMSLRTFLGARPPLLDEKLAPLRLRELESFFVYPSALPALGAEALDATFPADEGLRDACERLGREAVEAVRAGADVLLVTDGNAGEGRGAVPALLAVGVVHAGLVAAALRTRASIVVASDEPRDPHGFACLLGYGADAICPRLALETVASLGAAGRLAGDKPDAAEAQRRFRKSIESGVLKIMSKMGIADVASYRGAQLFEAVGLAQEVVDLCLPGTPSPLGGIGFAELEREALERCGAACCEKPEVENPGYVKFRAGGEPHATNPDVVEALRETAAAHALRRAVNGKADSYAVFERLVNERAPIELRDLLVLQPAVEPAPLDEVEPARSIVRRFSSGGMSYGALSAEAHETVSIAFNRLGARSNCGEGGEDPARFRTERNSRIKQIASGRFGVTPEYARFAEELQIKIAQGSKPGEGGQLPAHKVSADIARLRHTMPGIELISPPPHHDIYSIEDLAQLIFDLRQVNPAATVSVKLVSERGVGLVAAGCVKALADVVHVAGADGGTGASPLSSIKQAGTPWELGLAETQQTLVESGLRGRVRLRVDGGLKTGRDVVMAALLGADEVSFGTALLLAEGCLMVRSCHLDTCPVGIATQRPELRAKFAATPEQVEAYLLLVAEEVRRHLSLLGLRSFEEAVGRVDLLARRRTGDARPDSLELEPLLVAAESGPGNDVTTVPRADGGELGELLARDAARALEESRLVELTYPITNSDRAVGARLGGDIAERHGAQSPPGRIRAHFAGSAGQSFGAFLAAGVELALVGEANDYVGKSMGGGRIILSPPRGDAGDPVLLGNTVLYGATGGELYCAGRAGERFAVRNSGATAVVEGTGDHACEYMTGGTVVILGPVGRNLGAGMSGGVAYVLDEEGLVESRVNPQLVAAGVPGVAELAEVRRLVERHLRFTDSARAAWLLERWGSVPLVRVAPKAAAAAALAPIEEPAEAVQAV